MADIQEIKSLAHNILSVDGLSDKLYRKANKIHLGIASLAVLGGLIVFIEMVLNYCGARAINIYIGLILNVVLIFYFTRPKLLPLLYVKKVRFVIAHILLFCTTMSLLLYLVPIKSNPNMVAAFLLFGLAVIYLDCVYGIHSKTYRRLSIILVYTIAIITFIATPSRALYMKWFGFYPLEVIYTSELEEKYSELEILQNKVIDEKKEATIDYYIEKIKAGETLTEEEIKELEEIKKGLNRGKIPTAIGSVIDTAKIEAEKARLMAEIERLNASIAQKATEAGRGNEGGIEKTLTLQYLRTLHPFNGKGMGTTMYTAEFGTDYKKGDLLVVSCSKDSLVWLDGEGGGWLHPDPDGRKKITTMTHGPGHILMQVPKGKNANIEVWRYLPL